MILVDYTKIDAYLEEHIPALLEDLSRLVAIDSERREALPGMPFGREAAECLSAASDMIRGYGFSVKNYDNYVITADMDPELEPHLDILAHLDVVPAGDGWQVTKPFAMKIEDGRAYGRGTSDDKGPALCALYAMRAIKELGIPLKKNVRLILGSDEECGSSDLKYYFAREKSAPLSFSPDASFPLINIEKGGLRSGFTSSAPLADACPRLVSFQAGVKLNVVPDKASAVVQGLDGEAVARAARQCEGLEGIDFSTQPCEAGLQITARGKTAHASSPSGGRNAITALLALLAKLPLSDGELHRQMRAVSALFPHNDFHGSALGVALEDEVSGKTTLSLDILTYSAEAGLQGMFDCRACLSASDENTTDVISERLRQAGVTPMDSRMYAPHYVPEDSRLVRTLLGIYNEMTGKIHRPICIGGGTYVHEIENGVAFGCGTDDVDTRAHSADEFMPIDQMLFSSKVFVRAILALCGEV